MQEITFLFSAIILLMLPHSGQSEEIANDSQGKEASSVSDSRQLVSMPDETRMIMRDEMLSHLSALNEIIGFLANNNLDAAANVAETKLGKSSMGKHRATGKGPGRFMPLEMRNIGWSMHESATKLSQAAKDGDLKGAYGALQRITSSCVACHYSYRTQ
ncbi:MAG: cytochrome C [Gammaproteobacteria bacterium]|nr:MAG: cytochrome C [Gammaproteobacteria bacterium]